MDKDEIKIRKNVEPYVRSLFDSFEQMMVKLCSDDGSAI
jgi:activator of HSP90 ATPase